MVYGLPVHGELNWDTKLVDSITAVKATADAARVPLVSTSVQTTAAATVANKLNIYDATSGALAPQLPASAAVGTVLAVRKNDSSTNAVTVTCQGSDTFLGGATTFALSLSAETIELTKQASNVWTVTGGNKSLSSLDARYTAIGGTVSGSGDPEGVTTATVGTLYRDTTNGYIYEKKSGSGNTGWVGVGSPAPRFAPPSGTYVFPTSVATSGTTASLTNGTLRVSPVFIPQTLQITRMGAEVTVIGDVGSKLRIGVYADNGAGYPGALVLDAGQIAGDSATVQEITLGSTLTLNRGWYWLGGVVQSVTTTQPTVRTVGSTVPPVGTGFLLYGTTSIPGAGSAQVGYAQSGISNGSGLPANFSSTVSNSGFAPRLFFKLA